MTCGRHDSMLHGTGVFFFRAKGNGRGVGRSGRRNTYFFFSWREQLCIPYVGEWKVAMVSATLDSIDCFRIDGRRAYCDCFPSS